MTYSLTWLPEVLREAGLAVAERPGWQTRGHGDAGEIKMVICHHTAEKIDPDLEPDIDILSNGRPGLAGPLCNLGLGQNGTFYIIAAGKAWHAGRGRWKQITDGNSSAIGIEAENNGTGEPWPEVQMNAYAHGCAAIAKKCGFEADMVIGHKEWAPIRKIDPSFDMDRFRERVLGHMKKT